MSEGSEKQLISFFLYSLFVYPVTNWLIHPSRKYARWKKALFAVLFLLVISGLHMMYDKSEEGPNHYELLGVPRAAPLSSLKKVHRSLSLELHPDKNPSEDAAAQFRRVQRAFEILSDKEKRREYHRLGDAGVKISGKQVIDYKYILIQLIVYYMSTGIFAFMMTMGEPTGAAFSFSIYSLSVMLLVEMLLIVQEIELPGWFLPYATPFDIIAALHRMFPAFMNGCRCIAGAYYVDHKSIRVAALQELSKRTKDIGMRMASVGRTMIYRVEQYYEVDDDDDCAIDVNGENRENSEAADSGGNNSSSSKGRAPDNELGLITLAMKGIRKRVSSLREGRDGTLAALVSTKEALISDPSKLLRTQQFSDRAWAWLITARNIAIYLLARWLFIKKQQQK